MEEETKYAETDSKKDETDSMKDEITKETVSKKDEIAKEKLSDSNSDTTAVDDVEESVADGMNLQSFEKKSDEYFDVLDQQLSSLNDEDFIPNEKEDFVKKDQDIGKKDAKALKESLKNVKKEMKIKDAESAFLLQDTNKVETKKKEIKESKKDAKTETPSEKIFEKEDELEKEARGSSSALNTLTAKDNPTKEEFHVSDEKALHVSDEKALHVSDEKALMEIKLQNTDEDDLTEDAVDEELGEGEMEQVILCYNFFFGLQIARSEQHYCYIITYTFL